MTTQALVGPLQRIYYNDGRRVAADLPRNTLDPRYKACHTHHPACDCREAMLAEDRDEYRALYRQAEQAAAEILAGHPTWAWWTDPRTGVEYDVSCQCTGCQIARRAYLRMGHDVRDEQRAGAAVAP